MRTMTHARIYREAQRFENSVWNLFLHAGSLLLTVITILVLFFGVFLARSR